MQKLHPNALQQAHHKFPPAPFSAAEAEVLDWFRKRYWEPAAGELLSDETIAYMLLRVALGHREELAAWLDGLIGYRDAEGVNLSDLIDRRIASGSKRSNRGTDVPERS